MSNDGITSRAAEIGAEHGRSAASWVEITAGNASKILQGIEDCDPAILDAWRTPDLSGEFAGDYTEDDLAADLGHAQPCQCDADGWCVMDDAATAWLDAASEAFWAEVERMARGQLESERTETLRSAGFPISYVDRSDDIAVSSGALSPYSHHHHAAAGDGLSAYVDLGSIARGDDAAGQTSTADRSNFRSLTRDYPETFTPTSYVNVDSLGAFISDLTDDLVTVLCELRTDYPLYDEDDLSVLEDEEITESWDAYVSADLGPELRRAMADEGDAWDALSGEQQREMFWAAVEATDSYPEHNGLEVCWRYDKIIPELAGQLGISLR